MIPIAVYAETAWDQFTIKDPTWKQWCCVRPDLIIGWHPWQTVNTGIFPKLLAYVDAYAIYNNNPPNQTDTAVTHPEYILRDDKGNKLYIPWGCSNGTCPQFAGNFAHEGFIDLMIGYIRTLQKAGYKGVYLDDVDTWMNVTDGINPATPNGMTPDRWSELFVRYLERIREEFPPPFLIAHNAVWFKQDPESDTTKRQIDACDWYNMERGYGDPALNSISIAQQLAFVDFIHSRKRNVIQMEYSQNPIAPGTLELHDRIALFKAGYQHGDLMIVKDLFPNAWNPIMDTL